MIPPKRFDIFPRDWGMLTIGVDKMRSDFSLKNITSAASVHPPGKIANPFCGQLKRENEIVSVRA